MCVSYLHEGVVPWCDASNYAVRFRYLKREGKDVCQYVSVCMRVTHPNSQLMSCECMMTEAFVLTSSSGTSVRCAGCASWILQQ